MRIDKLNLRPGESVVIGAPVQPVISDTARAALAAAAADTAGVREAHLPQFYASSLGVAPAQALVIGLEPGYKADTVMASLGPRLVAIVPIGVHLDVWPLPLTHALFPDIRKAGCQLFARPPAKRPWWNLWR